MAMARGKRGGWGVPQFHGYMSDRDLRGMYYAQQHQKENKMSERTAELTGRLDELQEVLKGLQKFDLELRQNIANGLGKIDGMVFAGMSAQATLIAHVAQTLGVRSEVLQKALTEPDQDGRMEGAMMQQPADLAQHRRPKPVPKDEGDQPG